VVDLVAGTAGGRRAAHLADRAIDVGDGDGDGDGAA
jgi:hypothetical protein